MLRHDGFASKSSSTNSTNSGETGGKHHRLTSSVILTLNIGTLQELFSIYPKAESTFRSSIRAANLDKGIKGTDFQSKKERALMLYYLLGKCKGLKESQIRSLADAILVKRSKQKSLDLLKSFAKEEKPWYSVSWGLVSIKPQVPQEETMWRNAHNYATTISDSRFLSNVKDIPVGDSKLSHDIAAECEETAYDCLKTQLDSLASGISQQILSTQKEELDRQLEREVKSEEEKELKVSRAEFVRRVEDLCRERSRSWVV